MSEEKLNEIAPWGKEWGRTSKRDYKNIVTNLAIEVQNLKAILYMRDMLYNPCHALEQAVELEKDL